MTDKDIQEFVYKATQKVIKDDTWLLTHDISEQSISHRIASYLQELIDDYHVDCEYNGDVDNDRERKSIWLVKEKLKEHGYLRENEENEVEKELTNRAVFPDIIVHRRGTNENNLCIIEVKKSSTNVPYQYDYLKLEAYTSNDNDNNLKYQLGIFIEAIIHRDHPNFSFKYFKGGKEI